MEHLLFGFANSMFQSSVLGDCCHSNWTNSMSEGKVTLSEVSISHWKNYQSDILKMKQNFGVTTYRVSIEWSQLEPEKGQYDHSILMIYKEIAQFCNSLKIKPMFTLHHFTEPLWFAKAGGFENTVNIQHFVEFCMYVYSNLHTVVNLWCTFNEPAIYAFMGYLLGQFPPHCHNLEKTIAVLKNLLNAHIRVYTELKHIDNTCQIGIVHNVLIFKQLYKFDFVALGLINFFNTITNDLIINFFKTGEFSYVSPILGINVQYNEPDSMHMSDFIGLNFYANPVVGPNIVNLYGSTHFSNQDMGDMYLPLDPEGFANAIDLVSTLEMPIYITEIGIADKSDEFDELRQKFVIQYLGVIENKLNSGVNILGCYFWTFRDNYEWNQTGKLFGFHNSNGMEKKSCEVLKEHILLNFLEYEKKL